MIELGGLTWERDGTAGKWVGRLTDPNKPLSSIKKFDADVMLDEIERLRTELERTRQAWVNGDDPMCDDVCVIECKGPCGATS